MLSAAHRQQMPFQSTLPRRERLAELKERGEHLHFNPRSREGSDIKFHHPSAPPSISIHAPAKGATLCRHDSLLVPLISIHAPAKGATAHILLLYCHHKFQSTLPRRERLILPRLHSPLSGFQSTLPRRERHDNFAINEIYEIFQSTLPRRERPWEQAMRLHTEVISIHAPAKGATACI